MERKNFSVKFNLRDFVLMGCPNELPFTTSYPFLVAHVHIMYTQKFGCKKLSNRQSLRQGKAAI